MPSTAHLFSAVRSRVRLYRRVLAHPGALGFFGAAALARTGVAMTGLGLLWAVHGATGSFAVAGAATGALALAEAVVAPQTARLVDRWGQGRALVLLVPVHVIAVIGTVAASTTGSVAAILVGAAVVGASIPQPGALSAARWVHVLADRDQLPRAFALEASVNDVVFLAGPPLVTVLAVSVAPWCGIAVATACVASGSLLLAAQRSTAPPARRGSTRGPDRRILTRSFAAVFGVNVGLGCFFGALPVAVTAAATGAGWAPWTGLVLAISSAASLISGLVFGAVSTRPSDRVVLVGGGIALIGALATASASPALVVTAVAIGVGGTAIAPLIVTTGRVVERSVAPEALTQGFTWVNTASAAGIAGASALAGVVVDASGPGTALLAACALVAIAPLSALLLRRPDGETG